MPRRPPPAFHQHQLPSLLCRGAPNLHIMIVSHLAWYPMSKQTLNSVGRWMALCAPGRLAAAVQCIAISVCDALQYCTVGCPRVFGVGSERARLTSYWILCPIGHCTGRRQPEHASQNDYTYSLSIVPSLRICRSVQYHYAQGPTAGRSMEQHMKTRGTAHASEPTSLPHLCQQVSESPCLTLCCGAFGAVALSAPVNTAAVDPSPHTCLGACEPCRRPERVAPTWKLPHTPDERARTGAEYHI